MKESTKPKKLRVHFLPMEACPQNYRVVTAIRTPNEKVHGFVYQHPRDRNQFSNSRDPDRYFSSRMLAGRDLTERAQLYKS